MFRIPRVLKKAVRTPKTEKGKKGKHSKLSLGVVAVLTAAGLGSYVVSSMAAPHDPASAEVKPPAVVTVTDGPTTTLTSSCGLTTKVPDYSSWQGFAAASTVAEKDCTTIPTLDIPKVDTPVVAPAITAPVVAAPADSYVHNLYPTTPATTPVTAVTKNATTVTIIPDCPTGQLPLEIPTTSEWQCVADPTVVKPVVVAPAPVTPVVVPVTTTPVVAPVSVDPAALNPELDPFMFRLKTTPSYFSWVSDPTLLVSYGKALCGSLAPLSVPVPDIQDPLHPVMTSDVLLAVTTAATVCPGKWVVPTLDQITATPPQVLTPAQITALVPVVVAPVVPSNDVVLTA